MLNCTATKKSVYLLKIHYLLKLLLKNIRSSNNVFGPVKLVMLSDRMSSKKKFVSRRLGKKKKLINSLVYKCDICDQVIYRITEFMIQFRSRRN